MRAEGWSVEIAVTNATRSSFELGVDSGQLSFGLMLFATGEIEEVEEASRRATCRRCGSPTTMEPAPPAVLAPDATWRATLSGRGSLADESYLRVAFGPLRVVGEPPEGMEPASSGSPTAPTALGPLRTSCPAADGLRPDDTTSLPPRPARPPEDL